LKVKTKYPPNFDRIKERFGPLPHSVVFTYGDILYVPSGNRIPKDLKVHEKVHTEQQGDDPEAWWERYLEDDAFRLEQELEAYKKQFNFYKNNCKIKKQIPLFLDEITRVLSGPVYGNIISFDKAKKLIGGDWN